MKILFYSALFYAAMLLTARSQELTNAYITAVTTPIAVTSGVTVVCNVTNPPTISVTSSGYSSVWVKFLYNGASWRLPMVSGSSYSVKMPTLPSGVVSYRIEAGNDPFDPVSTNLTIAAALPNLFGYYTYTNSETLGIQRKPSLSAWKTYLDGNPTGNNLDTYWRGVKLTMNYDYTVIMAGYTNNYPAYLDPLIRTRSPLKVGTIWFKARFTGNKQFGTLYVEKSTESLHSSAHTLIQALQVPYTADWIQYRIDIESDSDSYYRIRHPSSVGDETIDTIVLKDIVFSAPAADVVTIKNTVDYNPGYPSRHDPVTFSVSITNVFNSSPATNISPKLIWRRPNGAWNTAPMPFLSNSVYQVTLPAMDTGDFEYYYRTDFTGYAYNGPLYPTINTVVDNGSDFSQWLKNGYISETKSPTYYAYYGDFANSQLYNVSVKPPVCTNDNSVLTDDFDYLSFNIRRFRSMHDSVSLLREAGGNAVVQPLVLSGDYTWQTVFRTLTPEQLGMRIASSGELIGGLPITTNRIWSLPVNEGTNGMPVDTVLVSDTGSWPLYSFTTGDTFVLASFCSTNGVIEIRRADWIYVSGTLGSLRVPSGLFPLGI